MTPVDHLRQLGFSEYEARSYVALLGRSPLSGYELAKVARLPRANIYAVLVKLERRGAVLRSKTAKGVKYAPITPSKFFVASQKEHGRAVRAALGALTAIESQTDCTSIMNVHGYPALVELCAHVIRRARRRLLIALCPAEAKLLANDVAVADERRVDITTLCLSACPSECDGCRGDVYRYRTAPSQQSRWILVIADDADLVAGEISGESEVRGFTTDQRLVVELGSAYVRNSIAVAAIIEDLGNKLDRSLKPATRSILKGLGPPGSRDGFIEYMTTLLQSAAS